MSDWRDRMEEDSRRLAQVAAEAGTELWQWREDVLSELREIKQLLRELVPKED